MEKPRNLLYWVIVLADLNKKHALRSASSVQSALSKLINSGLIVRTEEGYSLTDPLLRIFINGLYFTPDV